MLISINAFFSILVITLGTFMIERYVLLEPPMEASKQQKFYILCFLCVLVTYAIMGDAAQAVALIFGALNICLGRKKHRIRGSFMVLPLIGLMNGVAAPLIITQLFMEEFIGLEYEDTAVQLGIFAVYLVLITIIIMFYFKGREWRKWFGENMKDRSPSTSERIMIFISGIVLTAFSGYVSYSVQTEAENYSEGVARVVALLIIFFEIIAFVATLTIIFLVMQGNKQKYYHDRVSGMQFSVIATMADIVEDRDASTGGHIKRTAKYVEIIGKYLLKKNEFQEVLNKQYLEDMVVAAPLHDIGKISVPDAILNKPGRLDDEEFEIMKKHAAAGRDVLQKAESQMGKFDYLEIAKDMAEYHHEWFNGKGYPEGKSGNEIPLCARIMAVADVFDALTSKRCYKDAMPVEKAYSIISSESGTHFDPVVAEAFLNSKTEIEEAMRQLSEEY